MRFVLLLALCLPVVATAQPVIQSTSSVASDDGTTLTTLAPSGVTSGDTLLLLATCRHNTFGADWTTPTGWTRVEDSLAVVDGPMYAAAFIRTADGTATDTPSLVFNVDPSQGQQAVIMRITGTDGVDVDGESNSELSVTQPSIPSVTVTDNNSLAICVVGFLTGGSAETATWPSPWSENIDSWSSSAIRHTMTIGSYNANSGATTADTVTIATDRQNAVVIVVLAPSAGGGPAINPISDSIPGSAVNPIRNTIP